jgi:uncharacterized protein (UPF0333 family)
VGTVSTTTPTRGTEFTYTLNATCVDGSCSNVTLWVDPLPIGEEHNNLVWILLLQLSVGTLLVVYIRKRAQGTTEYIVVVGIVLVIIGIVLGTFTGLGSFSGEANEKAMRAKLMGAEVAVTEYILDTNQLQIQVKNTLPRPMKVSSIVVSGVTVSSGQLPAVLQPEQQVDIYTSSIQGSEVGARYARPVTITYAD